MFAKLSVLAVALPLASALTINPIQAATTGGTVTITWTASTSDPSYFSIEMVNTAFHNTFAIANNVQTSLGSITIQLPQVPVGDGYSVEAIATNDINTVYSQSGDFAVGAASSSSTTAASTTATAITTGSTSSGTLSTPLVTPTTAATSASAPVSGTGTSSASGSASATPSNLSSGAAPLKLGGVVPAAALLLSAVAGAAMVF